MPVTRAVGHEFNQSLLFADRKTKWQLQNSILVVPIFATANNVISLSASSFIRVLNEDNEGGVKVIS